MATKALSKTNFAENYEELEQIVADFEERELDLEKDLPKFERGMALAHALEKQLGVIENTVVEITRRFSDAGDDAQGD